MRRAALLGAVMGVFLGGAILAVLALQVPVVEWPDDDRDVAFPATPEIAEPPTPRTVDRTDELGPALPETSAPAREQLADAVGITGLPSTPRGDTTPSARSDLFDLPLAPQIQSAPADVAGLLALRPPVAAAIGGFRSLSPSTPPPIIAKEPNRNALAAQLTDLAPVPTGTVSTVVEAQIPAPKPLLTAQRVQAANALDGAVQTTRKAGPTSLDAEPAKTARSSDPAPIAASRVSVGASEPVAQDHRLARQPQPDRKVGSERSPMILWLVSDLPEDSDASVWAVGLGRPVARDRAATLPPLNQPETLAGFIADLNRVDPAGALALSGEDGWSAAALAPFLSVPEMRERPILYPATAARDMATLDGGDNLRTMPIYARLEPGLSDDALDAKLNRIGERARRDGIVVVQLSGDPALLQAVTAWRSGPGADLDAAQLVDLFGG